MILNKKRIIHIFCSLIIIPSWRRSARNYLKKITRTPFSNNFYKELFNQFKQKIILCETAPDTFLFKEEQNPLVSIIVPVYNQYNYTHLCLWSILQNTKNVSYEIILADDCSTDETETISQRIQNINVVRTNTNTGFLKNCNNAAQKARGKYVLFLNNDTQVQPDWLSSLVDLMESDDKIGLVGSQLLYPDVTLQEAGGIIFQDASGWNYGRNDLPVKEKYNYVKEVDYISGASIMLKRSLWEELGGFDEQFAPAYYEDTDLAFQVRQKGLKVVYQPKSKVIHFEGKSNGTDLTEGQKKYQVINQQKFYEKWKNVLAQKHGTTADSFFVRDRTLNKKTLLFIDAKILTYDQDTGSRAGFQYLEFFVKHGLNVKFLSLFKEPQDYHMEKIQQMGIEVICLPDSFHIEYIEWLQENGQYIDFIYLNRPDVAEVFFQNLRKYTHAKIIYQGHDLHFCRLKQQYDLTKDKAVLKEAKHFEKIEKKFIPQMDVITFFSDEEIQEIKKWGVEKSAEAIPLYLFDLNQMKNYSYNASDRSDILFIGGYRHHPNADAAQFLVKEIMPLVWEKIPDLKVHLVGSNPPEEVLALASDKVIVDGFVSDEELEQIYTQIRLSVIPLRFGAGVKGKVLESINHKVPVLTTPIGMQGIPQTSAICVQETVEQLAQQLTALYQDIDLLNKMSAESDQFIEQHYSEKTVLTKFSKWMEIK